MKVCWFWAVPNPIFFHPATHHAQSPTLSLGRGDGEPGCWPRREILGSLQRHSTPGLHLAETRSSWMIDDNRPPVAESLDRVTDMAPFNRNQPRSRDLGHAVGGQLKLTLDYLADLFLSIKVLVNQRTAREVVMREGHVGRVKIGSLPTGQSLDDWKTARIRKGHGLGKLGSQARKRLLRK